MRSHPLIRSAAAIVLAITTSALSAQGCELLCNADFEDPAVALGSINFINEQLYPCWQTSDPTGIIEVWGSGYVGVPAYSGNAFVELNSYSAASLFQDFTAGLGSVVTLSFAHRARSGPFDVMSVELGQGGVFTFIDPSVSDGLTWGLHTYTFTLPATGSTTFTIRLSAVSTGSGNVTIGNFLDHIHLTVPGLQPQLSLTSTATCEGLSDGTASAAVANGTAPFNYSWSPGGATGATAPALSPGTYVCTIFDDNGCSDVDSVVVVEHPVPDVSLASTPTTCYDSANGTATVTVLGGTEPYAYVWSPPVTTGPEAIGLSTGTYQCDVTDANGCEAGGSTTITGPTAVVVSSNDEIICAGDGITLHASASGGTPGYSYAWSPEGPIVGPAVTTDYSVTATDAQGCLSASDVVTVTVPILPAVQFTTDTTAGCAPSCIDFSTEAFPDLSFEWDFGDGDGGTSPNSVHCYSASGTYDITLTLKDVNGCSVTGTEEDLITIWEPPVPMIEASSLAVALDEPMVEFNDQSSSAVEWSWDFGDGSDGSTDRSPSHEYEAVGCFTIMLVITDIHQCTGSDSTLICVKDVSMPPFVPNAFTPDGDGINDVLTVINVPAAAKDYAFLIFDRWGAELFSSTAPEQGWDGSDIPIGTYAWKLRYLDVEAGGKEYMGHVNLLR